MAQNPPSGLPARLPNAEHAIVSQAKVYDYLLSLTHPIGRFKAVFFRALGYRLEQWEHLRTDLLQIALSGEAVPGQESPHGQKYEVRGTLTTPSGRRADLVTVWIVLNGETTPLFVTAFPGE
jgi:hypothetical protein